MVNSIQSTVLKFVNYYQEEGVTFCVYVVRGGMFASINESDHEDITELLCLNPTFSQKTISYIANTK